MDRVASSGSNGLEINGIILGMEKESWKSLSDKAGGLKSGKPAEPGSAGMDLDLSMENDIFNGSDGASNSRADEFAFSKEGLGRNYEEETRKIFNLVNKLVDSFVSAIKIMEDKEAIRERGGEIKRELSSHLEILGNDEDFSEARNKINAGIEQIEKMMQYRN